MEVLTQPRTLATGSGDPGSGSGERGVSLVETLVALLILSFVAVSTLAMFSQGMRLNASGTDYTAITNVAKDKVEELLNLDYRNADLVADQTFTETRSQPPVTVTWRVAEHRINQDAIDPNTVFGSTPMTSTSAGAGNVKIIAVTVSSLGVFALGQRTVTVQAAMIDQAPVVAPTPAPTPTP